MNTPKFLGLPKVQRDNILCRISILKRQIEDDTRNLHYYQNQIKKITYHNQQRVKEFDSLDTFVNGARTPMSQWALNSARSAMAVTALE
jgi:hypothetical protein